MNTTIVNIGELQLNINKMTKLHNFDQLATGYEQRKLRADDIGL